MPQLAYHVSDLQQKTSRAIVHDLHHANNVLDWGVKLVFIDCWFSTEFHMALRAQRYEHTIINNDSCHLDQRRLELYVLYAPVTTRVPWTRLAAKLTPSG